MAKKTISATEILLPNTDDLNTFAVIACDQFTSDGDYWNTLANYTDGKLSMLNMILPEYYLNKDTTGRIADINKNIKDYALSAKKLDKGMILTVRDTIYNRRRVGLVCAIDLEDYDFTKGAKPIVRPTEATITERIPPRLVIRKDADVEFAHIMMFIDDDDFNIIEDLYNKRDKLEKVYDFDLNMDGGHLTGYYIKDCAEIEEKFIKLSSKERMKKKYGEEHPFLLAVGDGNHSLATAKTHWENIKKTLKDGEYHPARYALCEVINIYDEGIVFEPIHRLIKGINREDFLAGFNKINHGTEILYCGEEIHYKGDMSVPDAIKLTDAYIAEYILANGGEVDYIHGDAEVKGFVDKDSSSLAVIFDKINKADLFGYVVKNGNLPKKTFSIGEAKEKRYYLEGRKIVK